MKLYARGLYGIVAALKDREVILEMPVDRKKQREMILSTCIPTR